LNKGLLLIDIKNNYCEKEVLYIILFYIKQIETMQNYLYFSLQKLNEAWNRKSFQVKIKQTCVSFYVIILTFTLLTIVEEDESKTFI